MNCLHTCLLPYIIHLSSQTFPQDPKSSPGLTISEVRGVRGWWPPWPWFFRDVSDFSLQSLRLSFRTKVAVVDEPLQQNPKKKVEVKWPKTLITGNQANSQRASDVQIKRFCINMTWNHSAFQICSLKVIHLPSSCIFVLSTTSRDIQTMFKNV